MRSIRLLVILVPLACCDVMVILAQDTLALSGSAAAKANKLQCQYIAALRDKSEQFSKDIEKSTNQYLDRLQKVEAKLQRRVAKVNPSEADNIFSNSASKYQQLKSDVKNRAARLERSTGIYLPWNDTAVSSLKYLATNPLTAKLPINSSQLKDALSKVKNLEAQFKQAENIKAFITQHKEYLKQRLANFDVGSDLKRYNSTAYYYSQQLKDYQESLKDETRAEQKVLSLLRRIPAFSDFMQKYGGLAGLFNDHANY